MKHKHNIAWDGQMHGILEDHVWVGDISLLLLRAWPHGFPGLGLGFWLLLKLQQKISWDGHMAFRLWVFFGLLETEAQHCMGLPHAWHCCTEKAFSVDWTWRQ